MSTRMKDLIPILTCRSVPESIDFYTNVLGFEVVTRLDDVGESGWASLRNGNVQIMLGSAGYLPETQPADGKYGQVVYYFYPENLEAVRDSVRAANYPASDFAVRFYGMKEFEVTDPSGHMLVFGQETDEAPGVEDINGHKGAAK